MNTLDQIFQETGSDPAAFARKYADYLSELLSQIDAKAVASFIQVLLKAREESKRIFFIGNGGSAATASHFANDIAIGTRTLDKPFRALSLTDNVAVISAISNDDGYDEIFIQQLQTQMEPGDVVVAISASGNSANIVKALEYAKLNDAHTVALVGFDGGLCMKVAELNVLIKTPKGEYGPVEDMHMFLDHLVGAYLSRVVKN
ncbi:MAG: sugar isomerase [Rhodospirillaceae bacterium]|nr:MAG: sugar isomerase [Rhodospirillaceae bacterium]